MPAADRWDRWPPGCARVGQAVQQGTGQPLRAEDLGLGFERQVRCHNQTPMFVRPADHSKEQLRARLGERHIAQFIQDQDTGRALK
jgi:hypothetical protein